MSGECDECGEHAMDCDHLTGASKPMEWISIDDRKPPQDIPVLVSKFDGRKNVCMNFVWIATRYRNDWVWADDEKPMDPKYGVITHWMPLPEPPKDT